MGSIRRAYETSRDTVLGNCRTVQYEARGVRIETDLLMAGDRKFGDDFWVRDGVMMAEALVSVGRADILRNGVQAILHLQQAHPDPKRNGLVFRKLSGKGNAKRNIDMLLPFLRHKHTLLTPEFATAHGPLVGPKTYPLDSYPLTIIAAAVYVRATNDIEFAVDYMTEIDRLFKHLEAHAEDGLIVQPPHGCWRDHWSYTGKPLLIQLFYQHACEEMADLKERCSTIGPEYADEALRFRAKAQRLKQQINHLYWNGTYYITAVEPERTQLSSVENSLAILYGIADSSQQESILEQFRELYARRRFVPMQHPAFSMRDMYVLRIPFNYHYHRATVCLPWNQCVTAKAMAQVDEGFAEQLIEQIAQSIAQYGNREVLRSDYTPFRRIGTGDEHKFTWGALSFIEAVDELNRKKLKHLAPLLYV